MFSLKYFNPIIYIKFILRFIQKVQFKECGKKFIFNPCSKVITLSLISVTNHVFIAQNSYISAELTLEKRNNNDFS